MRWLKHISAAAHIYRLSIVISTAHAVYFWNQPESICLCWHASRRDSARHLRLHGSAQLFMACSWQCSCNKATSVALCKRNSFARVVFIFTLHSQQMGAHGCCLGDQRYLRRAGYNRQRIIISSLISSVSILSEQFRAFAGHQLSIQACVRPKHLQFSSEARKVELFGETCIILCIVERVSIARLRVNWSSVKLYKAPCGAVYWRIAPGFTLV